jgi:hypothetical protein
MSAIESFERNVLIPALDEVCRAPALLRDYNAKLVTERPAADDNVEALLTALTGAMRRQAGPSLVLSNRERPEGISPIGGHYVMTVMYAGEYVSPAVIFWMRFNNKLHVFDHRYDNAIAQMPITSVTKHQIQNHILTSFDFYKLYAFADTPFPGYR